MTYVRTAYPDKYEDLWESLFHAMFMQHLDISEAENVRKAVRDVFSEEDTEAIVKATGTKEVKQALNDMTKHVVEDLGAFGAPWFWVDNGNGKPEPFFGSDRFHFMWDFLDLPHTDLELQLEPKPPVSKL